MTSVMYRTDNDNGYHLVGVLGAYSNTKETNRQLHDLVERARTERTDRRPRLKTKPSLPKELPADVQQSIIDGYRAGASMKQLARDFGVHRTTIRAALDRHEVPPRDRSMSDSQVREAVRRYEVGESLAAIGERLGFNAQTISNQLRKRGVQIRSPHERR